MLDIARGAARHSSSLGLQPPSRRRLNYIPLLLYRFLSSIYSLVITQLRLHTLRIQSVACSIRCFARCNTVHDTMQFEKVEMWAKMLELARGRLERNVEEEKARNKAEMDSLRRDLGACKYHVAKMNAVQGEAAPERWVFQAKALRLEQKLQTT